MCWGSCTECVAITVMSDLQIAVNSAQSDYMHRLLTQQMIHDFSPMTFKLVVNRNNLVQDTLNALVSTDPQNYKKPLQVYMPILYIHVYIYNNTVYINARNSCMYIQ